MESSIDAGLFSNDSKNLETRFHTSLKYRSLRLISYLNMLIMTLLQDFFDKEQRELLSMNKVRNGGKETSPEASSASEASNAELSTAVADVEAMLTETSASVHVLRAYLQWPSEETSKPVKLLFDRGKDKNFFTQEKMDNFFSFLESGDSDQESMHLTSLRYNVISDDDLNDDDENMFASGDFGNASGSLSESNPGIVAEEQNRERRFRKKRRKQYLKDREKDEDDPVVRMMKEHLRWKDVKIFSLQRKITLLKEENDLLLSELVEIDLVQKNNGQEVQKSATFYRFLPSSLPKIKKCSILQIPNDNSDSLGYPNDCQSSFGKSDALTFNDFTSVRSQNSPFKLETGEEKKSFAEVKDESYLKKNHSSAIQNVSINPDEKATGGEGIKSEKGECNMNTDLSTTSKDKNHSIKTNNTSVILHKEKASGKGGEAGSLADPLASTSRDEVDDQRSVGQSSEGVSFSVQQDDANGKEFISLASKPQTSVALTLHTNYKLLLITLADNLLSSDVENLKSWTTEKFSIDNTQNATDVLFQLDEKGAINAEDLNELCGFFKSILRYDLVHIAEAFLLGDYSLLRAIPKSKKRKKAGRIRNSQLGRISWNDHASASSSRRSSVSSTASGETVRNPATSGKPQNNNEPPSSGAHQIQEAASSSFSVLPNPSNPGKLFSRTPNENQSTARVQQDLTPTPTGLPTANINKMVVPNGSTVLEERRTMAANVSTRTSRVTRNTLFTSSNGLKHSKFQRPSIVSNSRAPSNSGNREVFNVQDDNWLCSHYKRHCFVKFECCDKFWPCHRCHNNQSACGRKKLKSRDTKMLKCVYCNKEQQFGQFCCDCGAKFSNYFCGLCKHLTGHDDFPYHCEKCGICRIHGDRSFHCDVCGVCLDVQLQGNHKCREGSAHDECCICLEDAFTGCQILPCSHKVHKECATQMIRSGM
ncbi:uncharacterized protein LOC114516912 isoform X2 [Dendronephthya gigantea]|uniref:uncharacterized protein LOC114516912 isoform X2 n=1 Tax=Dendronephthya gigantea TaxID=151771 RepID=UPI00106A433A|nr:uncharacterized protein LOC114516912 isoform X2 [Dendronephthya gigantea]